MVEIPVAIGVGWVVSPVISWVISKAQSYIENKFFRNLGIESELQNMKTTLREILSIMGTIEKQKIVDPNQAELVQEIKDAVYDTEDVIDEFEYHLLEEKSSKQKHKTVSQIASSSCCVISGSVFDYNYKNKVIEVNKRLDKAKGSANTLLSLIDVRISNDICPYEHENDLVTSSKIIDEIIGRQSEREQLMDLLFNHIDELPTVIPIVGQGGIGKTTLAQKVFNDPSVIDHFDHRVWLSVSDSFDKIRLTKEMVKDICHEVVTAYMSFDTMQSKLEQILKGMKVLLVLDDVWYNKDDKKKYTYQIQWKEVLVPLMKAKAGSKIILTTREGIVGSTLGTTSSIYLDGLNEVDSWSLFELCALDDNNKGQHQQLVPIGKEIVNKLRGLPLAIKVVGMDLQGNSDVKYWQQTLCDNMLDTNDIMNILHRSYEHLPKHLKRCFSFCSLFPKDYHLNRDRLVHMWIAQGFVRYEGRKSLEDVGKSYFKELLARSVFQMIIQSSKKYYVMHDLMNDLASHISKGEYLMHNKGDPIENMGSVRHLSLHPGSLFLLNNVSGLHKLRTLISLDDYDFETDEMNFITMLKRIRVLDLQLISERSLFHISESKHLRYLSFRLTAMAEIPKCFGKLYHLSALFLRKDYEKAGCYAYELILPEVLCNMSNLVLVDTSKTFCVRVGYQSQLDSWPWAESTYFRVKKMGHQLHLLGNMNNIKGFLSITGLGNVTSREQAIKAQLHRKERVLYLVLDWRYSSLELDRSKYHEVIEALCPNSCLESLEIDGYPGTIWPSWLESKFLSTVKEISFVDCPEIDTFPALGQLPLLEDLHLCGFAAMRRIHIKCYGDGTFPSLRSLTIDNSKMLEEILNCPKLYLLKIKMCPMFTGLGLNDFPTPQYLTIECSPKEMMAEAQKKLLHGPISLPHALTNLEIVGCKGLITLKGLHKLVFLRRLFISDCPDLVSLPEMGFFNSLEFLAIFKCPTLNSFPKNGFPISLQLLCIGGNIHQALEEQIRSKNGPDWGKVTAISGCDLCALLENAHFIYSRVAKFKVNEEVMNNILPSED